MAQIVAHTSSTIAAGENLGAFYRYTEMIGSGLGLVIADPMFCGGVTAIHRIADLAGQHRRSFASHDCAGPVNLAVGTHLALHQENAWYQEMVRAFYFGWYEVVATGLPRLEQGRLSAIDAPGHGITLRPELWTRSDAHIEETTNRATAH